MGIRIKTSEEIINGYSSEQYSSEQNKHWQDVRERAAIAAMQGVMNFFGSIDYNRDIIAKLAVKQADALVEELKSKRQRHAE